MSLLVSIRTYKVITYKSGQLESSYVYKETPKSYLCI
eukprot:UN20401